MIARNTVVALPCSIVSSMKFLIPKSFGRYQSHCPICMEVFRVGELVTLACPATVGIYFSFGMDQYYLHEL